MNTIIARTSNNASFYAIPDFLLLLLHTIWVFITQHTHTYTHTHTHTYIYIYIYIRLSPIYIDDMTYYNQSPIA